MEHAALAPVEGEHVRVEAHAGEGLVDDRARDAGRLRVAHHAGNERVEIAAAFGGRGRRGERDHDKERRNQSEHGKTLVAPAWSYTVTLSLSFFLVIAGLDPAIHDELQQQESVQLRKRHLIMDARVKPGHDVERLLTHSPAR